jgi:hypothetical protein
MNDFTLTSQFRGYNSKSEQTNVNVEYLGPGSKNVLIDFASRIVSRAGYILYGAAAATNSGPIRSSYEWDTTVSRQIALRSHYDFDVGGALDFTSQDTWFTLKTGLPTADVEFAEWWDTTEGLTRLLMVCGDKNIYSWSGGMAKVASNTAVTLTMQGVLTAKVTLAFNAGVAGVSPATITDSANNFLNAGFAVGDLINVTGSTANNRIFQIGAVDAGTITLIMANILATEAAGPAITIHNGYQTWTGAGLLNAAAGRAVIINGTTYTYTGGENTDTLTGLVGLPAITVGTLAYQSVLVHANPGAINASFVNDLIGVETNQVWLGSKTARKIYIAKATDFTNFTIPATRAQGDPALATMDNYTTKIITLDNTETSASSSNLSAAIICGGTSDFTKLEFRMSSDNAKETILPRKIKASNQSGIIGRGAICNTHAGTVYISNEPVMDFLEKLESRDHPPISDIIKPDFESYDMTDVHLIYLNRAVGVAIPREGIVLIYDLMRNLWHSPQYMPISRLGVLKDGSIIGHSSISAETYTLFTGTNDLGNYIPFVARFPYNNHGERGTENKFTRYWTDGYITANGELNLSIYHGFAGIRGLSTKIILGTDPKTVQQPGGVGLGQNPLGFNPFGGAPLEAQVNLLRLTVGKKFPMVTQLEYATEYSMNTLDAQFALVSHGPAFLEAFNGTTLAQYFID